jgi:hypothetical protein
MQVTEELRADFAQLADSVRPMPVPLWQAPAIPVVLAGFGILLLAGAALKVCGLAPGREGR